MSAPPRMRKPVLLRCGRCAAHRVLDRIEWFRSGWMLTGTAEPAGSKRNRIIGGGVTGGSLTYRCRCGATPAVSIAAVHAAAARASEIGHDLLTDTPGFGLPDC